MTLRYYQKDALDAMDNGWARGLRCQLLRMGTGTGKSKTAAHALADNSGGGLMMAHRREIVAQLSLALARENVRHRVLGSPSLARLCMATQIDDLGTHFVSPNAKVGVASTDSLASITGEADFLSQVTLAIPDEFHHYVRSNSYGKALGILRPTCRIMGPTATPRRTDGLGLGLHADGFAQEIVFGPPEAQMKREGFLCDYRIYAPPNDFNRDALHVSGSNEDFKKEEVKAEAARSTIHGDAVKHYVQHASGKTTLAFVDSLENAATLCAKFRAAGVKAEVLSGKTDPDLRSRTLKQFAQGKVDIIISVALIDEGFDCPNVAVVLDLAPTTSLIRYRQRFGRGWRPHSSKDYFLYFDFVGNVRQHGLPDSSCVWSLNRREKRSANEPSDEEPVRTCDNPVCGLTYLRVLPCCPYCSEKPTIVQRNGPKFVDGDLIELDEATMARMRGEIAMLDAPASGWPGMPSNIAGRLRNLKHEDHMAQAALREATSLYGGWQDSLGRGTSEGYKRFYFRYRIDMMSAWALKATEANNLNEMIRADLARNGITNARN